MPRFAERAEQGIARCKEDDLHELDAFQLERYGDRVNRVPTRWVDWLYRDNPNRSPDGLGIWICRRDGRIVGQQGEIAFALRACDDDVRATAAVALMVDPVWRLRGVGPALSEVSRRSSRLMVALSVSEEASRMYGRRGWTDLGEIPRYTFFSRPAAAHSLEGHWAVATPLASAAASVAAGAARLRGATTRLEPIDRFDQRADSVWELASREYPVLSRRDASALAWRFDDSPFADTYRRHYLIRGEQVVGYVVVQRRVRHGEPAIEVLDYLASPRDVGCLFAHCIGIARRDRAVAVEVLTRNPAAHRRIVSLGFLPLRALGRRSPLRFMLSVSDDDPVRDCVAAADNWFVTRADADLEFESGDVPESRG
jgi:hypothetical protein